MMIRRILGSMCVIACIVCTTVVLSAVEPAQDVVQAGPYEAALQGLPTGSVRLILRHPDGRTTEYPVDDAVRSLTTAAHSPAGRVTIVAEAGGAAYVLVVAPESAAKLGDVLAASAAVSDTGRFVLWDHQLPRSAPAASSEYRLADVDTLPLPTADSIARITGRVVYPSPSASPQIRASSIASVGDSTFAFLELSPRGGVAAVVALRVAPGEEPSVVARPLTATDFVEPSQMETTTLPANLTMGPTISRVSAEGLVLQLDFAGPSPAHKGRSVRLRIW